MGGCAARPASAQGGRPPVAARAAPGPGENPSPGRCRRRLLSSCQQLPPKPRLRPGRVNVPAVVYQVCWTRSLMVTWLASSPKVPAGPPSVPASWPMLRLLKTAELAVWLSASTTRLVALAGLPPAPAGSRMVSPRTVTLWHRWLSVAFFMVETMTGVWPFLLFGSDPPNCANPVHVSWLEVIVNSWPETEMLEASAPSAVSPTRMPAIATAGTATIANRRHLTLPCALLLSTDMTLPFGLCGVRPPPNSGHWPVSYSRVKSPVKHFDAVNGPKSTN